MWFYVVLIILYVNGATWLYLVTHSPKEVGFPLIVRWVAWGGMHAAGVSLLRSLTTGT
jgi:hypothetical protein